MWRVNSQRNVPEFKSTLHELHGLSKSAPDKPDDYSIRCPVQAIDKAIAAVPESQLRSPEFVLGVMNGMLKTAAEEYKAAIATTFVELVEYQRIPEDSSSMLKISTKILASR